MESTPSPMIYLHHKKITELDLTQYKKNSEEITELVAFCNELKSIPEDLAGYFPNMRRLDLWQNKLTVIPESISKLVNLKIIKLSANNITELPQSFGNLVNLELLFVGHNELKSLPDSFSQLVNLKELYLHMNHFEEFPKQIQSATNLMKLDLSENYITEVPAFIGRFKNLRELKLHRLRLKSLPEEIGELENLKLLDASMNQLSSIPESISKLTQLNGLLLTWNDFEEIPKHLPSSLEIIYIGGNKRKFTDESIGTIRVKPDAVEPNNIIDRVWLGSMIAGKNKHYLKSIGITHVLSVLNDCRPFYPDDFTYLSINLEDDDSEDIKQHFTKAIDFMDTAIYDSDGHVFVHCAAGVSRSATIVIAYLMKKQNLSFDDALKIVQTKRPVICPNVGFREQLKTYEEELKEQQTSVCVLS